MKLRAYLVDDEPLAIVRLRGLLERTGRVEVTGSTTEPEEAVAALTMEPPDVCFLDIQMPGMTGFELQRHLVATHAEMPIIFITAHGDEEMRLRALKGGAVDYLLKPFSEEGLLKAVQRALAPK